MKVAVVGLGVMGGSLARALAASGAADAEDVRVVGWAADVADREAAAAAGVDVATSLADAVADAGIVVLATPLSVVAALAAELSDLVGAHAVVTDVASLQAPALEMAGDAGLTGSWVTSHPLAGSERSGFGASRPDLYDGVPVYLSAAPASALHARASVAGLWESVGGVPEWVDAIDHDERMSLVSHLPQVASTALADAMAAAGLSPTSLGPGGRDATRLAGSSAAMWRDLLAHARPSLVAALRDVAQRLEEDAEALEGGEVEVSISRLERAAAWRDGRAEVDG